MPFLEGFERIHFNNMYKNFRINLINNEFESETRKDDKIIVHKSKSKYHVELDPKIIK